MTKRILQEDEAIVLTKGIPWWELLNGAKVIPDVVKDGKPGICVDYDNRRHLFLNDDDWRFPEEYSN